MQLVCKDLLRVSSRYSIRDEIVVEYFMFNIELPLWIYFESINL